MIKLRPYQQDVVNDIYDAWTRVASVLCVCPTGGGKTVIFSSIIHDHNGGAAAVVHRKEIVSQISLALARLEVKHRIIAPASVVRRIRRRHLRFLDKCYVDQQARVGVASVQTLASNSTSKDRATQAWVKQCTLAVFDEGHHYVNTGTWAKAVHALEAAKMLFVTATPERADGKGLGRHASGFVDEMVSGPSTKWLIDQQFLSRYRYYAPQSDLDVADLAVTASGDFNAKALRARVVDSHLIGDVVTHYKRYADGVPFIVFSTDVATATEQAAAFQAAGVECKALSGGTDNGERDATLDDFENGRITGLTNVDLFDEGFDVPAVVAVIMARPTQSLAKFLQMIGRALRILEGKTHAIIIDPVRNWERHGMPDWPRVWSLDDKERGSRGATDTIPQRACLECTQIYEAYHKACPYCGFAPQPPERSTPEQVDGDLLELDVDALAVLFEQRQRANMSDDEFKNDMSSRNVPPIGRARQLKAHQSARYRREVLHNLVGWWVGMQQPHRDMSEIYRRFYLRFGVDMSTAFTLSANDTDALINRITGGFKYDVANEG